MLAPMSLVRPFVRRHYPVGPENVLTVRVTHGMLGDAPCVVFEQEASAFGGALFSAFETVAQLYELELRIRRLHPGPQLRFVQYRLREPAHPGVRAVYEEVTFRGEGSHRYAARWEPARERLCFSASCPTQGWLAKKSQQA